MARIHYSMSGEGRGHAARAQVLVELLRSRHELILSASGQALEMLEPLYRNSEVAVRSLPGLRFVYDRRGELHRAASFLGALPFVAKMPGRIAELARSLERDAVDLVISDFEPLMPRAAHLAGIPSMSVDHQQFLLSYDLSSLPRDLRRKAAYLEPFSRPFYFRPKRSVISAFFFPPLRRRSHPVNQAGVLLRSDIVAARPESRGHLVAYFRRQASTRVIQGLADSGVPTHIYGHGGGQRYKNLKFFDIEPGRFAEDLACSTGLVTTAGNQVVGEALYLGKPVLAYPEEGNFEQQINAFFLGKSGCGRVTTAARFTSRLVREFADELGALRDNIRPERMNGNRTTLAAVEYEAAAATHATAVQSDPVRFPRLTHQRSGLLGP